MNILMATEYIAPKENSFFGGVNAMTINFAKKLAREHDVHIVTSMLDDCERTEYYDGVTIHRIGDRRHFTQRGSFLERIKFNECIKNEIMKLKPDIVNPIGFVSYDGSYKGAKKLGVPAVATVLEVWQGEWIKNMGLVNGAAGHVLESIYLRYSFDRYIAISNFTREKLIKTMGIPEEKTSLLYCGVDLNHFSRITVDEKFLEPTIITVCRLVPYKRVDDLIRAVKVLKSDFDNIKLLIVGEGPEEPYLRNLVKELGLKDNVIFMGKICHTEDLIKTMKRSHVFALSSVTEGFGMVIVEAMAAGIPYVAYDIPAIREVTSGGRGGLLAESKNYADLASKLKTILEDKGYASAITKSNEAYIKMFEWSYLSSSLERIFYQCQNM